MSLLVSLAWLIVIVADESWWQLLPWAVFAPLGFLATSATAPASPSRPGIDNEDGPAP